jgi:hypothetical protein
MRTFFHGNDSGGAVLLSLLLILALSLIFLSLTPRVAALKRFSGEYKARVLTAIQTANQEIITHYDLR